jgi:hypothetical protein
VWKVIFLFLSTKKTRSKDVLFFLFFFVNIFNKMSYMPTTNKRKKARGGYFPLQMGKEGGRKIG